MISSTELLIIERIVISAILGAIIGYEREIEHKPAGLRTHMLVCCGSTLFTTISFMGFSSGDPTRIAASVIAGIGFICAGVVMQRGMEVIGITTAATVWITAGIGMAIGVGYYMSAIITTIMTLIVLRLKTLERTHKMK
ncbi:MAG: MgtC/SapB family protein [Candidatus Methanomethylicota archaeon]|uniref:MgtC/SapB family protein n=1 Tax=Thermoproteota archaeon TaxID=2056631 RepID=A0A497F2U3_9CREN|nr:MAG: MgtC/SapB family protein [Candidatus Verstraetearchaeota archaeon]